MSIYTKTGDQGDTSRPGGRRVRKSDAICDALGGIDELNAMVGWCLTEAAAQPAHRPVADALAPIQPELLTLGALFAAAGSAPPPVQVSAESIVRMERQIDAAMAGLPPLTHFILPGGGELSCRLHLARTVCRRAERSIVAAADAAGPMPEPALKYINRLSDLLFVLARLAARLAGQQENLWLPPKG